MLAVIFIGSAIGGIAENNFSGGVSDAVSLVGLPQTMTDAVHWIFGDELDRPVSGGVAGLRATPAVAPSSRMAPRVRWRWGHASAWTIRREHPAST